MTKRLRGIWHAWHFQFALSSVVMAVCGSFCIACLHPLTRRYETLLKITLGLIFLDLGQILSIWG
ncbi:DUF3265 domain-containing protein [Vibrio vulnificus]